MIEFRQVSGTLLYCTLFALLFFTGCHRSRWPALAISVQDEIEPQPPVVGPATIRVRLTDANGHPVAHARMTVEGDMSHPGMSPVFAESREIASGRYQARIDLAMAGDWVLLLHIQLADGESVERQIDVKGVRAK